MVSIVANGKERQLDQPVSVGTFLRDNAIDPRMVAVMLNGTVLTRDEFDSAEIGDGAKLEIVRMVGGG